MNDVATTNGDGFGVQENSGDTSIVGKMLKFTDGRYTVDKTETLPADTTLVAVNVMTAWVRWEGGKPEHRVTKPGQLHPDREDLPDLDESQWPPGLNDEPSDPWRDTRYLHLIDPQTGGDYTFVTDSYGGRRAVGDLKSAIVNVRYAHPAAVPVVQLHSTTMKTRFGLKQRPEFKVVGWRGKQETPAGPVKAVSARPDPISTGRPRNDDMNDEIPRFDR
jgi:hypothetical protein